MDAEGDPNFIDGLCRLTGIDRDSATTLLDRMSGHTLLDLADAVSRKDKDAAQRLIAHADDSHPDVESTAEDDEEENDDDDDAPDSPDGDDHLLDFLRADTEEPSAPNPKAGKANKAHGRGEETESTEPKQLRPKPKKKTKPHLRPLADDEALSYGETVWCNGERALVRIPNGPGDTVGIQVGKGLHMVTRNELRLKEGILGLTTPQAFDLRRIQELAGIQPSGWAKAITEDETDGENRDAAEDEGDRGEDFGGNDQTFGDDQGDDQGDGDNGQDDAQPEPEIAPEAAPDAEPAMPPEAELKQVTVQTEMPDAAPEDTGAETAPLHRVMSALDELDAALPDITVGELRDVRRKLNDLMSRLNESVTLRESAQRTRTLRRAMSLRG